MSALEVGSFLSNSPKRPSLLLYAEFRVEGLRCSACVQPWTSQISALDGILDVSVDAALCTVKVRFDAGKLTVHTVREALLECPGCSRADVVTVCSLPQNLTLQQNCASTEKPRGGISVQRLTVPAEKKSKLEVQSTAVLVLVVHKSEPFSVDINSITELLVQSIQQTPGVWSASSLIEKSKRWFASKAKKTSFVTVVYDPHTVGARTLLSMARELCFGVRVAPGVLPPEMVFKQETREVYRLLSFCAPAALMVGWLAFAPLSLVPSFVHKTLWIQGFSVKAALIALLSFFVYIVGGSQFHHHALRTIASAQLTMDVLVSLSTTVTFAYSILAVIANMSSLASQTSPLANNVTSIYDHFFEMPALVITALLLGKGLESRARLLSVAMTQRDSESYDKPYTLVSKAAAAAEKARDREPNIDTFYVPIPSCLIEINDLLQLRAGDCIPFDGVLEEPHQIYVDESLVTGEARLVPKTKQDALIGASRVVSAGPSDAPILYRVTQIGSESCVGRLQHLVQTMRLRKPAAQRYADVLAQWFIPAVLVLACMTGVTWVVLLGTGLVQPPTSGPWTYVLFPVRCVAAVLAIACPCALGLSSSTAIALGIGRAATFGLLVRNIDVMECPMRKITDVVFDKTGTLTSEEILPVKVETQPLSEWPCSLKAVDSRNGNAEIVLLWCAASLQHTANQHPIARGFRMEWSRKVSADTPYPALGSPVKMSLFPGEGVIGSLDVTAWLPFMKCFKTVDDTSFVVEVAVGNQRCMERAGAHNVKDLRVGNGVCVAVNKSIVGKFTFFDSLRNEASLVVRELQDYGIRVWMCTGDTWLRAVSVAEQVGISTRYVQAELTPNEKAEFIRCLIETGSSVMMIGDGVNDAAPVAASTLGIALGVRAHLTMTAADVVVLHSSLVGILSFLRLSDAVFRTIQRNFIWALAFNTFALPTAAGIFFPFFQLSPTWAGCSMAASSALVVLNSALLLRVPPWTAEPTATALKLNPFRRLVRWASRTQYQPVTLA